jgi:hypothetical protein
VAGLSDIELDYEYLMQRALRRVVYDALMLTAELKTTPGDHHFYIEFLTGAFGVKLAEDLRRDYPERMTIVLQHQFEDLIVDEEGFSVTLKFKGRPERLTIPFDAVAGFRDPSAEFTLRFHEPEGAVAPPKAADEPIRSKPQDAEVVSLDNFRKK